MMKLVTKGTAVADSITHGYSSGTASARTMVTGVLSPSLCAVAWRVAVACVGQTCEGVRKRTGRPAGRSLIG
eukprot:scaffold39376_cov75-Phaeocystis_antarctica.AAC.2